MHPSENEDCAAIEMPRYRSHKQVWALKIESVNGHRLTFAESGYASIACDPTMFLRGTPVPGDYYVVYDDGYKSFSPAKAFEEGYTRLPTLQELARKAQEAMSDEEPAMERKTRA